MVKTRYVICAAVGVVQNFSERKNTALWNSKIGEERAIAVAEHLSEGCSIKGTARLVKVDPSTVRRLNGRLGQHGQHYHNDQVQQLDIDSLQADERHGFAGHKRNPAWEAELIEPQSKFIVSHVQGRRDETLIRNLLQDGANRLLNRHNLVLFSDGYASYDSLFPEIFGVAYQPARQGQRGRYPKPRYRIPRSLAHVQVVKHRQGQRLKSIDIRHTHGSRKRVNQALLKLGYKAPNTSAIERRNGTARLMSAAQTRKTLAFSREADTKLATGWWTLTVYNWLRPHRSLRQLLPQPQGKKMYQPRSPAMALGLTDHIFSFAEILHSPVYPLTGL
jgi:IS1 family transposase